MKLNNVIFYLTDVANLWFRNHETEIYTWAAFKKTTRSSAGQAMRKLRAEQRLQGRSQQAGETFTSYIKDIVYLCKRVNASMAEAEKIEHILNGIEEDAFQMLLWKKTRKTSVT